jgi:MFS family permease
MQEPENPNEPVSAAAWRLLVFLTLLNVLNFVDRTLIANLGPMLIADLGLSKTQIGWLAGYGFVFFYTLVGLFLGVAADRWRRIPLVAAGVFVWSLMTGLSGLAKSFLQLALPRIFVGVGEATLTPASLSMLGDVFPARRLAMATGVYYAGIPIGTAVSMITVGYLAPAYGWRFCFYLLGALGVVASVALLAFREPKRQGQPAAATAGPGPNVKQLVIDTFKALKLKPELTLTLLGGSLLCYGAGAALLAVTWLVQERGLDFGTALFRAGLIAAAAGFLGNLGGGTFADWCAKKRKNGHLFALIPMTAFFAPIAFVFYTLPPDSPLFYVCWFITAAGTSAWFGPLFATLQRFAPAHTRATTVGFALLVLNLLGVGPGPLFTGKIGDMHNLTLGLQIASGMVALAIPVFYLALRKAGGAAKLEVGA